MTLQTISIASIDVGNRLRVLNPAWVELLAEEISANGLQEPIHVVARGDRYQLVAGARRLAAVQLLDRDVIDSYVKPAETMADDAAVRLAEIKADLLRDDLTVLDRARYLAAWRAVHEQIYPQPKRGRKPAAAADGGEEEMFATFANIFSDAAKAALNLSQRAIYLLLKVASIDDQAATAIALHPVANKQNELLALASQSPAMQAAIVDMLMAEPAKAQSVTEALMVLGATPLVPAEPVYAKLSERFSRLPEKDQFAFFTMHESAIDLWMAKRSASATKAA